MRREPSPPPPRPETALRIQIAKKSSILRLIVCILERRTHQTGVFPRGLRVGTVIPGGGDLAAQLGGKYRAGSSREHGGDEETTNALGIYSSSSQRATQDVIYCVCPILEPSARQPLTLQLVLKLCTGSLKRWWSFFGYHYNQGCKQADIAKDFFISLSAVEKFPRRYRRDNEKRPQSTYLFCSGVYIPAIYKTVDVFEKKLR
ncbi:hypothetical protein B0H19DRAFT_128782 [Mycena capillaripes]|nr:hypothetical protein B0H19DRAFT_128782 [Mycena capillaripes]